MYSERLRLTIHMYCTVENISANYLGRTHHDHCDSHMLVPRLQSVLLSMITVRHCMNCSVQNVSAESLWCISVRVWIKISWIRLCFLSIENCSWILLTKIHALRARVLKPFQIIINYRERSLFVHRLSVSYAPFTSAYHHLEFNIFRIHCGLPFPQKLSSAFVQFFPLRKLRQPNSVASSMAKLSRILLRSGTSRPMFALESSKSSRAPTPWAVCCKLQHGPLRRLWMVIRAAFNHSEYAAISYFNFLSRPEDAPATLDVLADSAS